MKIVHVAAAVIRGINEGGEPVIFATQRGYGDFKGGWEFPGGKLEPGETSSQALVREIKEELDTTIRVGDFIKTVEYDYPTFHLTMDCYWCEVSEGELTLKEHESSRWLTQNQLMDVKWLPADVDLVKSLVLYK